MGVVSSEQSRTLGEVQLRSQRWGVMNRRSGDRRINLLGFWCLTDGDLYGRRPPDHFLGLLSRACLLGSLGAAVTEGGIGSTEGGSPSNLERLGRFYGVTWAGSHEQAQWRPPY